MTYTRPKAKAYLIAFYDTRTSAITRMQIAGAWPVAQTDLAFVHQLLVVDVVGRDYHEAEQNLRRLLRQPVWAWTDRFLRKRP